MLNTRIDISKLSEYLKKAVTTTVQAAFANTVLRVLSMQVSVEDEQNINVSFRLYVAPKEPGALGE